MRKLLSTATAGLLVFAMLALVPSTSVVEASSHREAPSTSVDPMVDNTDVYAWRDPVDPTRLNIVGNWIPFQLPQGGPNFYRFDDNVIYAFNIDNNGDAIPDIVLEFRFRTEVRNPNTFLYNTGPVTSLDDPDLNIRQFYTVTSLINSVRTTIASNVPVPPNNVGIRSTPNYETALALPAVTTATTSRGPVTVFAGQRDDPFFVDVGSAFDLFALRPFNSAHLVPLPDAPGVDGLAGFNVSTIAVQLPIAAVTANQAVPASATDVNAVIGLWATSSRTTTITFDPARTGRVTFSGNFTQVSRLGNPFVNELIVPLGLKDRFNASFPSEDAPLLPFVLDPEPARLIGAGGPPPNGGPSDPDVYPTVNVPPPPRNDLVTVFLTGIGGLNRPENAPGGAVVPSEQVRLNLGVMPAPGTNSVQGTPNRLGNLGGDPAGFPNGRRPGDDIVDIELRVLAGVLVPGFNVAPNNLLGDGANENDVPFLTRFPYLATPRSGYDSPNARTGTTNTNAPPAALPDPTPRP